LAWRWTGGRSRIETGWREEGVVCCSYLRCSLGREANGWPKADRSAEARFRVDWLYGEVAVGLECREGFAQHRQKWHGVLVKLYACEGEVGSPPLIGPAWTETSAEVQLSSLVSRSKSNATKATWLSSTSATRTATKATQCLDNTTDLSHISSLRPKHHSLTPNMATFHSASLQRWLFSLPPVEYALQHIRELLIGSLKCGPIPQHIAFIMDGNRRWARTHHVEAVEGHHMGLEALARVLEVCYKSGVKYVTIYAFSIENFKRSKYEVDALMDMAKTKLVQMSQHGELFDRYGAAVRILGDRSLVRGDVLEQVDKAVEMTKDNGSAVLNVCFPYTGREEIVHSIRETVEEYSSPPVEEGRKKRPFSETRIQRNIRKGHQLDCVEEERDDAAGSLLQARDDGVSDADTTSTSSTSLDDISHLAHPPSSHTSQSPSPPLHPTSNTFLHPRPKLLARSKSPHLPDPESISAATLTRNTYINCPPPELLIRTSGVNRLSDFMLWQVHEETEVKFINCLWPEFDLWKFLPVLVEWQWGRKKAGWSGEAKVA